MIRDLIDFCNNRLKIHRRSVRVYIDFDLFSPVDGSIGDGGRKGVDKLCGTSLENTGFEVGGLLRQLSGLPSLPWSRIILRFT